jgi:hypothetical protein
MAIAMPHHVVCVRAVLLQRASVLLQQGGGHQQQQIKKLWLHEMALYCSRKTHCLGNTSSPPQSWHPVGMFCRWFKLQSCCHHIQVIVALCAA